VPTGTYSRSGAAADDRRATPTSAFGGSTAPVDISTAVPGSTAASGRSPGRRRPVRASREQPRPRGTCPRRGLRTRPSPLARSGEPDAARRPPRRVHARRPRSARRGWSGRAARASPETVRGPSRPRFCL
jgi:hypothetical protein